MKGIVALCAVYLICSINGEPATSMVRVLNKEKQEVLRFWGRITDDNVPGYSKNQAGATPLVMLFDSVRSNGCQLPTAPIPSEDFALVVQRGDCSFSVKQATAAAIGAKALYVMNSQLSLYNSSTNLMHDPCSTNCDISSSTDLDVCVSGCKSGFCARNPMNGTTEPFCCVTDNSMYMSIPNVSYVSVFVGFDNLKQFRESAEKGYYVQSFAKDKIRFNWSSLVILLLGTIVTAVAGFRAARMERHAVSWLWKGKRARVLSSSPGETEKVKEADEEIEQVTLSLPGVVGFLLFSSASLVGLFFLAREFPQETVIVIQVIFGISATFAFSHFVVQELVRLVWKTAKEQKLQIGKVHLGSADEIIGFFLSLGLVIAWFILRHEDYAWIMLDLLAAAVCCMFLIALRLPNLKLACVMLGLFFVYDIFMVFISPALFGGKSVMVEVARAGASQSSVTDNICHRTQEERMPMLFLVPKIGFPGSYSMLGLGDVFIPGLLVTYAARFDYLKAEGKGNPTSLWRLHKYYISVCVAYFFGLLVTLLANLFELNFSTQVKGQPALLYLVPFCMGTFLVAAWIMGDLKDLWNFSYEELYERMKQDTSGRHSSDDGNISLDSESRVGYQQADADNQGF